MKVKKGRRKKYKTTCVCVCAMQWFRIRWGSNEHSSHRLTCTGIYRYCSKFGFTIFYVIIQIFIYSSLWFIIYKKNFLVLNFLSLSLLSLSLWSPAPFREYTCRYGCFGEERNKENILENTWNWSSVNLQALSFQFTWCEDICISFWNCINGTATKSVQKRIERKKKLYEILVNRLSDSPNWKNHHRIYNNSLSILMLFSSPFFFYTMHISDTILNLSDTVEIKNFQK